MAAVEIDPQAIQTHIKNFPNTTHITTSVAELTGSQLLSLSGLKPGELDGLIGGPPCQGFSTIGKRNVDDTRNNLFKDFFRLVAEARPQFFVAENVPGLLNEKFKGILEDALDYVREHYTLLEPIKVKASDYGAPTIRTRVFFIGYLKSLDWNLSAEDFKPSPDVQPVKVKDALVGLPEEIEPLWLTEEDGLRKLKSKIPDTPFGLRVKGMIPKGVGHPEAIKKYTSQELVYGCQGTRHSALAIERYEKLSYGDIDPSTKSKKLDPDGFCITLRAGTASDKGSYQAVRPIHPKYPRVITPREGARLQGFPDWFVFHETKWHSFRQIGNSVSPIVSEFLLSKLNEVL
ncbi:cytosine-specific methyltransferase [Deinococcus roseus]|uniref:Cytosine-specific methyltransferase n=1 Tax=Deinococcus roseus TaxID=392414 RepID=A0ABQ2DFX7_9DEIO|nr:cytosine-specific methyltransferase [Deinococcus roseus]